MSDQFLFPGRTDPPRGFAGALRRRYRTRSRRYVLGAGRRGRLRRHRFRLKRRFARRRFWPHPPLASSSCPGLLTDPGSSVSVRHVLWQLGFLEFGLLLGSAGEASEASVSGPGGRSVGSRFGDIISSPISIAGAPTEFLGLDIAQMRDRQAPRRRHATQVRPAPANVQSRREKFCSLARFGVTSGSMPQGVAVDGVAAGEAGLGMPSSATSLIFEYPPARSNSSTSIIWPYGTARSARRKINRSLLSAMPSSVRTRSARLTGVVGNGERKIWLDRDVGRPVRLLLRSCGG